MITSTRGIVIGLLLGLSLGLPTFALSLQGGSHRRVTTLDASVYALLADARGAYVALQPVQSWPSVYRRYDAVSITFTAGYGAVEDVPEPIRQAILLIVQRLFDGAGTEVDTAIDRAVHALIAPFRTRPL